jgi:hypothetical protein
MAAVAVLPDRRTGEQRIADELFAHRERRPEDPMDAAELDLIAAIDSWIDARRLGQLSARLDDLLHSIPVLWHRLRRDD